MVKMAEKKKNINEEIFLEKLTVNISVGNDKQEMEKAKKLLEKLTGKTPVICTAKKRLATWGLRPGLPIGYKVTLRGEKAKNFLAWMIESKYGKVKSSSVSQSGGFSMGVHEYLDLTNIKYDSDIGVMGFELSVNFAKPGYRVKNRSFLKKRIPQRHRVRKEEVIEYLKNNFKVEVL